MKYSIIFGLGPAGLFLVRQLAKNNIKIIGIGRRDDIGLYSRHIERYIAETIHDINQVIFDVMKRSKKKPKAYICSDQYLTLFLNNYPEIFKMLDIDGMEQEVFKQLNSKKEIHKLCQRLGILTPKSYSYYDILDDENVTYPIIFKLDSKKIKEKKNPIGKIKVINNSLELQILLGEIERSDIDLSNIVIQQFLLGDNSLQFSFGGYFKEGIELAGIVVNQIRQYPQGVSSLVIENDDKILEKRLRQKVNSFVKVLSYSGFLEIEFKLSGEEVYLLDINPRPWGWVSILGKKYENFNQIFIEERTPEIKQIDKLIMWKSPIRNLIGYIKNYQNVKDLKNVLENKYFNKYTAYDIYDRYDLRPMFAIARIGLIKTLKKLRQIICIK